MFVYPEDEKRVMKILENMGMTIIPRKEESQHFEARDKNGGRIEMHVTLYSKMLGDIVVIIGNCLESEEMQATINAGIKSTLESMLEEFDIQYRYINKRRMM